MRSSFLIRVILVIITLTIAILLITRCQTIDDHDDLSKSILADYNQYKIFFIETNHLRIKFDERQLCAIESAAFHNRHKTTIYVLSIKAVIENQKEFFKKYENVKFHLINSQVVLRNTPLHDWYKRRTINDTYMSIAELSDVLRMAIIYKYGGLYLDLDTITIKDLSILYQHSAFTIDQNDNIVGNAFFVFNKIRHPFLMSLMKELNVVYDKNGKWGHTGTDLITKMIKTKCVSNKMKSIRDLVTYNPLKKHTTKCNISLYPFYVDHPFGWRYIKEAFVNDKSFKPSKFIKTYSIHFNSYLTSNNLKWGQNTIYEFFASSHCPFVYNIAKRTKNLQDI